MSRKNKKKKNKSASAQPVGSFVPAHDDEPNIKPSKAARHSKKGKKLNTKSKPNKSKSKSKKKGTKNSKQKSKTQTKSKSTKTKTKSKKKVKKSATAKDQKRSRAKTTSNTPKSAKNKKGKKRKETTKTNNIQLNDISHTPNKPNKTPKKQKRFPWDNWTVDKPEEKSTEEPQGSHQTRRSSLGSIRELHKNRIKNAGGHRSHKKKHKKHKKKHKNIGGFDDGNVDIYDPIAMKKKRRKEKQRQEFKVVPKHHVKRSSLPTYNSIRKNNPKLQFFVKKETQRDLALLLDQPEKRKKSKQLKNLSRNGFALHVNKRYRLEDGRVGVCKYKGRTEFGKSSEDWIGLVIGVGEGEHDGSVNGRSYFRCRMGKGLFVRPYDIIQDMGSQNKMLSKDDIKLAKLHIKKYKKMKSSTTTSSDVIETDKYGNAINDDGNAMMQEKFYNSKSLLDKNKGKKAKKKKHHTQV